MGESTPLSEAIGIAAPTIITLWLICHGRARDQKRDVGRDLRNNSALVEARPRPAHLPPMSFTRSDHA